MYFSPSTKGFYAVEIHGTNMPSDVIEITEAEHQTLMQGQAAGMVIQTDDYGRPFAALPQKTFTLEETKANKIQTLAAYRYEKETSGITVNGVTISTDRTSQSMLNGAQTYFTMFPSATIDWKGESGWTQVDQATALAIAQAVGSHVQACFTNERSHAEAITALTSSTDIDAYDFTTGWPA